MADDKPTGTDWSDGEVDLIVADYLDMLRIELAGETYVKRHRNEALQKLTGRSHGSIEFKHQNISAVLLRLGFPWIRGYKPMHNYQGALLSGIERFLQERPSFLDAPHEAISAPLANRQLTEAPSLFIEAPPILERVTAAEPPQLRRLIQKFDPAARDERNRALGKAGEERVFYSERSKLASKGRDDLARQVRWVSQEDGDGAGYDILSFDACGRERLLEVKTTTGYQLTPFYISESERSLSEERADAFRLVRVYDFIRAPRAFELAPPLANSAGQPPGDVRDIRTVGRIFAHREGFRCGRTRSPAEHARYGFPRPFTRGTAASRG
jgi:hypothetical protein